MDFREDQLNILNSAARIRVGLMGRRWGKTAILLEALKRALDSNQIVYYVTRDYGMLANAKRQYIHSYGYPARQWAFQSQDYGKSGSYYGCDLLLVDEAAVCDPSLLARLEQKASKMIYLSTPVYNESNKQHWYEAFFLAMLFNHSAECFHGTSFDNFMIHQYDLNNLGYSDYIFRKEILAELG